MKNNLILYKLSQDDADEIDEQIIAGFMLVDKTESEDIVFEVYALTKTEEGLLLKFYAPDQGVEDWTVIEKGTDARRKFMAYRMEYPMAAQSDDMSSDVPDVVGFKKTPFELKEVSPDRMDLNKDKAPNERPLRIVVTKEDYKENGFGLTPDVLLLLAKNAGYDAVKYYTHHDEENGGLYFSTEPNESQPFISKQNFGERAAINDVLPYKFFLDCSKKCRWTKFMKKEWFLKSVREHPEMFPGYKFIELPPKVKKTRKEKREKKKLKKRMKKINRARKYQNQGQSDRKPRSTKKSD